MAGCLGPLGSKFIVSIYWHDHCVKLLIHEDLYWQFPANEPLQHWLKTWIGKDLILGFLWLGLVRIWYWDSCDLRVDLSLKQWEWILWLYRHKE